MKTLDWEKLEEFVRDRDPVEVDAGIIDDWFWTAATVYRNGEWLDRDEAWVLTAWGDPGFKAEMKNGDIIEVYASKEATPEEIMAKDIRIKAGKEKARKLLDELKAEWKV